MDKSNERDNTFSSKAQFLSYLDPPRAVLRGWGVKIYIPSK